MDYLWERTIPFYNINIKEITDIFNEYDKNFEILDLIPIDVGCRNSNYKVHTNKGFFLLRICPLNDTASYKKEKTVSKLFYGYIRTPKLLFLSENNITQRICLIYEYINGSSLQEILIQRGNFQDNIIIQVAESAACIHNHDVINNGEFNTLNDYPSFLTWYDLFLEKDNTTKRIGNDIKKRVKKLISDKRSNLNTINKYISFIHSDFRPANMMIDKNKNIWIVDWEFSGFGHSLADIGQFFRYSNCFELSQIKKFEVVYNSVSKRSLPSNWYELSKLRDLINPLQMLGEKENLPEKYFDLKNLILDSLNLFGY